MTDIISEQFKTALNRCYLQFDPHWYINPSTTSIQAFCQLLRKNGMNLQVEIAIDKYNRVYFKTKSLDIIDSDRYLLWLLTWG